MVWTEFGDVRNTPYIVGLLYEAQSGSEDAVTELFGIYKGVICNALILGGFVYNCNDLFEIFEKVVESYHLESGIPFSACLKKAILG